MDPRKFHPTSAPRAPLTTMRSTRFQCESTTTSLQGGEFTPNAKRPQLFRIRSSCAASPFHSIAGEPIWLRCRCFLRYHSMKIYATHIHSISEYVGRSFISGISNRANNNGTANRTLHVYLRRCSDEICDSPQPSCFLRERKKKTN